jgi:hypothetical protein
MQTYTKNFANRGTRGTRKIPQRREMVAERGLEA